MPPFSWHGLTGSSALERLDLLADPVARALSDLPERDRVVVVEIDPDLADTAALCAAYDLPLPASGNCVLIGGRRDGAQRVAACVVAANTRADVNNVARRRLDVRKASFLAHDEAVEASGMEYGGITPVGLPGAWRLMVDAVLAQEPLVVVGSGLRRSKLLIPGEVLAALPGAEVVEGLGVPI